MYAIKLFSSALLALLLPVLASGQTFEDDMQAILDALNASEHYTIESAVKVYSKKGGALLHDMKASVSATKTASHTVVGEIEILTTENQVIIVDREEKLIQIEQSSKTKPVGSSSKKQDALNLEALTKLASKDNGMTFKLTATSGTVRTYSASNAKMGIRSVVIRLDVTEKKLLSYTIEQQDETGAVVQYVVVNYTHFTYANDHPEQLKTNYFIVNEGGTYKASAGFKGYKVVKK